MSDAANPPLADVPEPAEQRDNWGDFAWFVVKLALAYTLLLHQLPLAELLEHYERPLKNGMPALLLFAILAHALIDPKTLPWYAALLLR